MGGNALKTVKTVRKVISEYNKTKNDIKKILDENEIKVHFARNLHDKEDHGDLDIFWSAKENVGINMHELIKSIFIPNEIVVNGTIISFDFDNFQIDMIKVSNIEFSELYFSYGDFGNIAGSMLKKYGLIFKDNGLFINYEQSFLERAKI